MKRSALLGLGMVLLVGNLGSAGTAVAMNAQETSPEPEQPPPAGGPPAGAPTSCIACHANETLFDAEHLQIVKDFEQDVHAQSDLSCQDCHGGNPDPALAEDKDAAMDKAYAPNPYRGAPAPADVPAFCGRCHSDPEFMRRFKPDARVDQQEEYWTSRHGQLLKTGDTRVAVCTSCHGAHGILGPANPRSGVYPTHVAETCRGCHADAERMSHYQLPDGSPLPIDQYARWRQSVHAAALLDREDLSAPTCNDCHGNHGAIPPGVQSIAFICGECHGREATLFRKSPKEAGFERHDKFLAEAGPDGCFACHDEPEPAAQIEDIHAFPECTTCHSNHGIVRPTLAFLSPLPATPCAFCHLGREALPAGAPEPRRQVEHYEALLGELQKRADELGLQDDQRFNWLVDQALLLEPHLLAGSQSADKGPQLRPAFERLFNKFRIGKTTYTYLDPSTGKPVEASIRRCKDCHSADSDGLTVARELLDGMRQITTTLARADRTLLFAQRGGVQTGDAAEQIDASVDAQIQLEVLLHGFKTGEGSAFDSKYQEGIKHAKAALEAGRQARHELAFRREGLAVSLVIILLVLLALGMKIRQLSASGDLDHPD